MKNPYTNITHSLSLKLSLGILGMVLLMFILCLGFLFERSRQLVRQEATERATHLLDNTALRVVKYLTEVETATDNICELAATNLTPDSLSNYTSRVVELNPNINGCSITLEPDILPQQNGRFSVYTIREGNKTETAIEGDYNYYEKVWYKTPKEKGNACWVDPYNDFNEGTLSSPILIASYCKPLYSREGRFIGVIATDLSIEWISNTVSAEKPYPHSYCIMLGSDGHYFVHPDRLRLINQSISSSFNPKEHPDIEKLGKDMTSGKTGNALVDIDGTTSTVFYRPVEHTGWSIALVCPEEDIYSAYNTLTYIVTPILLIGLLLMLFICRKSIKHYIEPLDRLAQQAHHIAEGNFDEQIPRSDRKDVVGDLQNGFAAMQKTINEHVTNIQRVNEETEKRNEELIKANQLAIEADKRKDNFVHEMALQIRTPLNIIAGFMQVLQKTYDSIPKEEVEKSIKAMSQNAFTIKRMAHMLFDVTWRGAQKKLDITKEVELNAVINEAIDDFNEKTPHETIVNYTTNLPTEHYIRSNSLYLHRVLRELLINAKKFASEGAVNFDVHMTDDVIRFTIEDHGPGIPEEEREHVFEPFVKLDNFSEGLGLGLGLTLQHAKNLGGSMILDPDYKEGVRFIVEIPNS